MYDNSFTLAGAAVVAPAYPSCLQSGQNATATPKPIIADAMLRELSNLIEKATMVRNRQSNFKERIFGAVPAVPCQEEKCQPLPQSFVGEVNYKLTVLNAIMDGIISNCVDLERLA